KAVAFFGAVGPAAPVEKDDHRQLGLRPRRRHIDVKPLPSLLPIGRIALDPRAAKCGGEVYDPKTARWKPECGQVRCSHQNNKGNQCCPYSPSHAVPPAAFRLSRP